jgi:hypothetical protein
MISNAPSGIPAGTSLVVLAVVDDVPGAASGGVDVPAGGVSIGGGGAVAVGGAVVVGGNGAVASGGGGAVASGGDAVASGGGAVASGGGAVASGGGAPASGGAPGCAATWLGSAYASKTAAHTPAVRFDMFVMTSEFEIRAHEGARARPDVAQRSPAAIADRS